MIELHTFETLYGIDVKNKIKEWRIQVINQGNYSVMQYSYGYINGKKTECSQNITVGKNIGKSNETTHYQQAIANAKSKWKQKIDEGYNTNIDLIRSKLNSSKVISNSKGPNNENIDRNVDNVDNDNKTQLFPMLANDFSKHKHKLVYPGFIQPKLDGYRMIYNSRDKSCMSRQGKEFDIVKKTMLFKELQTINEFILDGELYVHGGTFEHLGIIRKKKIKDSDLVKLNEIEYHVYDIINESMTYNERLEILKNMEKNGYTKIKFVQTEIINNQNDVDQFHKQFVNNGYEGSIIRNRLGKYRCKARSSDLLKYKDFEDNEFQIIDFTYEKDINSNNQKELPLIVWICKTSEGNTFHVRPKGTREERQHLYTIGSQFVGRNLHVKYFELTEGKVPRFPTTKSETYTSYIRDVIE